MEERPDPTSLPPTERAPQTSSDANAVAPAGDASGDRPHGRRRRRNRRRGRGGGAGAQAQEHREGSPPPPDIPEIPAYRDAAPSEPRTDLGRRGQGRPDRNERSGRHDRGERSGRSGERHERHGDRQERSGDRPERHADRRRDGDGGSDDGRRGEERRHGAPRGLALDPEMPNPDHEPEIPLDRLDRDAVRVISRLRHMGHQAYFVGGCVRDALVGRTPKDFDLATDAHPGEVRAIFRNCRLIGRRFRLAHVFFRDGKIIEVATFRQNPVDVGDDVPTDADLLITRDNVFGTAEEDARRRDFTVNGLFYDPFKGEVIDYVGGRADVEAHRISTIGDPEIRMREDPVRALRAVRFAARLGFTIEPEVFEAMRRHAAELSRCAPPRVLEEIFKILRCTGSNRAFELLRSAGLLPVVLPALAQAIDAGGPEARTRFHAHLAALDEIVRSGEEVSDAVLLGALLIPMRRDGDSGGDQLLAELVQTARLPRRMAERARMALQAQRLFQGPPRRRRRGGLAAQAYFVDALTLLRVTVKATGEGAEALARWEGEARSGSAGEGEELDPALLAEAEPEGAPAPASAGAAGPDGEGASGDDGAATSDGSPGGRGRRRRRGGRRRRRRGQGQGPGGGGDAPPPSAGAA